MGSEDLEAMVDNDIRSCVKQSVVAITCKYVSLYLYTLRSVANLTKKG